MNKNRTNTKDQKKNYKSKQCSKRRGSTNVDREVDTRNSTNDPSWYNTNPDIAAAAANLNFSRPLGIPFDRGFNTANMAFAGTSIYSAGYESNIPGIISMDLMPSVGYTDKPTDALNMASTAIYSFVRHANSGHSNYDAPDLMLYIMANTQVYAFINYLLRVYKSLTLYSGMNRYLPKMLVTAQGVDYDDAIANIANFRYQIDALILKAQSLAVPSSMSIFARHAFLYSNVYAEGTSPKDQLYLYNPAGFWRFELDDQGAGQLKFTNISGFTHKVQDLINYGNDMIDRLITDEDMGIMSGDILKAYGVDGILKLNTVSELQPLVPIYDPVVLRQFKNAKIFDHTFAYPHGEWVDSSITQSEDKSYLVSTPGYHYDKHDETAAYYDNLVAMVAAHSADPLISAGSDRPSIDEILEITRLTDCFGSVVIDEDGVGGTYPIICASEIPVKCVIWLTDDSGKTHDSWNFSTSEGIGANYGFSRMKLYAMMSNFKYCPEVLFIRVKDEAGKLDYYGSYYDMDNYTTEDPATLDRIHDAVLMNMLAVPSIAAFTTVRRSV